ncbi:MAG: site-specific DNA-methyltransferase [Ectobacillus sp.]
MGNISKKKREQLLEFLNKLREEHEDDEVLFSINKIESELTSIKYGLVWEEHEERVDKEIETKVPVFTEIKEREISSNGSLPYNFLLEGDNLHSLYLLEKTHKNKIDVIYIDPPYNRGKDDFIYDDNYVDEEDTFKHSKWLSFMSKRLNIAYKLLNSEGVIFISIDDNEMAQLKMLCDSIFGESNCIGVIIQNKMNSKNDALNIQKNHEYILVYRKQANYIDNTEKPTLISDSYKVKKIYQEGEKYYYLNDPITTRGEGGVLNARPNLGYTVYFNPETNDKIAVCDYDVELAKVSNDEKAIYKDDKNLISKGYIPIRPPRVRGKLGAWTWELDKFNRDKHLIVITENKRTKSYSVKKRTFVDKNEVYSKDGKLYYNFYGRGNSKSIIEFSTNDGTKELNRVLGEKGKFNNPKNLEMIKYLIRLFPKRDALVLDFFAGSGTTGQAVLELNKSDGGNRRFILCTNNQNNICEEVTYKRLTNVIEGYKFQGNKETVLYEKSLDIDDLYNMESIIETVDQIEERSRQNFTRIIKKLEGNVLKIVGQDTVEEKVEGIPANLKYYKTDYIEKFDQNENYNIREELLKHIVEMVQLEHGVKIDNKEYIIILSDNEVDKLEHEKEKLKKCKTIYLSSQVLLTKKQEKLFDDFDIDLVNIPDYYFEYELREVGEI